MYRKSDSLLEVDLILDSSVGRARVDRWQRAWGRCASLRASGPLRRHPCRAQPGQRLGLFVPFHCAQAQLKLRHSAYPAAAPAAHSGASNSAAQSVDLHQPRHRPQALNGHEAAHGQTTLRCKTPEAAVGINLPQSLQLLRDRFALCLHRFVRRGHQVSGTNHQQGSAQPAAASSNNADSTRRGSKRSSSKPSGS